MEDNNNVEIFEDDSIIQLFDENNKPIDFYEIASIELDGKFYELLQPKELLDGIGEDEAVILEYEIDEKADVKNFKPISDESLLNRIFDEYLRAVSDEDCECGCGHCDGDCDCDDEEDDSCECNCESCHKE